LDRLARCCALRGDNVHRTPSVATSRRLRRAPSTHSGYFVTIVFLSYPNDGEELPDKEGKGGYVCATNPAKEYPVRNLLFRPGEKQKHSGQEG
jgi:hypothetical protein